jgi:hypothetical protein
MTPIIRTASETEVKMKISVAVVMTRPTFLTLSLTALFEPFLTVLRPGGVGGDVVDRRNTRSLRPLTRCYGFNN